MLSIINQFWFRLSRCVFVVVLLPVSLAYADDDPGIAELITNLESREFRTRQRASRELRKRGAPAVKLLEQRIRKGRLELAIRAMSIFESAYLGSQSKAADLADEALESFAVSSRQELAELATAVLARNRDERTKRSVARLKELGAQVENYRPRGSEPENRNVFNPQGDIPYIALDERWKGGVDGLKYLRRLDGTDFQIYLVNTAPLDEKAKIELETFFVRNSVERRGPLLGILGGRAFGNGVPVTNAVEGTAAYAAGIREGDIIRKMDGEELVDFHQLVQQLMDRKPGDTITLTITHDKTGLTDDVKVKLRKWEIRKKRKPPEKAPPLPPRRDKPVDR